MANRPFEAWSGLLIAAGENAHNPTWKVAQTLRRGAPERYRPLSAVRTSSMPAAFSLVSVAR